MTAPFGAALAEELPRLRRYAIGLAGDVETADDLLQDCMERAWKNQATITDERALFPWLRAILHNVNIDRIRAGCAMAVGWLSENQLLSPCRPANAHAFTLLTSAPDRLWSTNVSRSRP